MKETLNDIQDDQSGGAGPRLTGSDAIPFTERSSENTENTPFTVALAVR